MKWDSTLLAAVIANTLIIIGGLMGMWWRMSNLSTRVETLERDTEKNDDKIECIDKKVDDIRVELGKIETKLDFLVDKKRDETAE